MLHKNKAWINDSLVFVSGKQLALDGKECRQLVQTEADEAVGGPDCGRPKSGQSGRGQSRQDRGGGSGQQQESQADILLRVGDQVHLEGTRQRQRHRGNEKFNISEFS